MAGGEDYDPFKEIEESNEDYARARPIHTLNPGQEYKVVNILQMRSLYKDREGTYPMNTIVQYFDEGLKFQSIMPTKFNNKSQEWVNAMNKLIKNNVGPKVVFYGTVSLGNEVDLLRHTQQANENKLRVIQRIMSQTTPKKGDAQSQEQSPTKRHNNNNNDESPSKMPKQ